MGNAGPSGGNGGGGSLQLPGSSPSGGAAPAPSGGRPSDRVIPFGKYLLLDRLAVPALQPQGITRNHDDKAGAATVHVTIGRVEIRAVTAVPNAPSVKRAPAKPTMSLSEYLRVRGGQR